MKICVIPARGNSKRVPRKNAVIVAGKPVFWYTLKEALKVFDKVYVLSEDKEILDAAQEYGSTPFTLPEDMAGDTTGVVKASLYLLDHLEEQYEDLIVLQPSSPLRNADDIKGAYDTFKESKADFLVSVTETDPHHFHWAVEVKDDRGTMYFGDKFLKKRQELDKIYSPNGAIKIAKVAKLREVGHFFTENTAVYEMPQERSLHVATPHDFNVCKLLLEAQQ